MADILVIHSLPLERFQWDAKEGRLTASASRLDPTGGRDGCLWLCRLYPDDTTLGCCIQSHHTGSYQYFRLDWTERGDNGGVWAWYYLPVDESSKVKSVTIYGE